MPVDLFLLPDERDGASVTKACAGPPEEKKTALQHSCLFFSTGQSFARARASYLRPTGFSALGALFLWIFFRRLVYIHTMVPVYMVLELRTPGRSHYAVLSPSFPMRRRRALPGTVSPQIRVKHACAT
jgi:hypothetical protein